MTPACPAGRISRSRQWAKAEEKLRDLKRPPFDRSPRLAGHRSRSNVAEEPSSPDATGRNADWRAAAAEGGRTTCGKLKC